MEGTEAVGMDISDLGARGHRRQDVGDILQYGGPSGATVLIRDMGHDPMHRQESVSI